MRVSCIVLFMMNLTFYNLATGKVDFCSRKSAQNLQTTHHRAGLKCSRRGKVSPAFDTVKRMINFHRKS